MRQVNPVLLNQLRADYLAIQQLGSPLLSCKGMLVPRGMEDFRFLIKSCPRPIVSNEDPAEVQYAGGFTGIAAGVPKTHYTGNLQMLVTEAGHDQIFADYIVANAGMANKYTTTIKSPEKLVASFNIETPKRVATKVTAVKPKKGEIKNVQLAPWGIMVSLPKSFTKSAKF